MLKSVRKTLINLSTSWRLFEESSRLNDSNPQALETDKLEQRINYAYDTLIASLLNRCFQFYLKYDPTVQTSFIVGRYVGSDREASVPEISITTYASANGYNGMLLKTVKPGKVDFVQYSVPTASDLVVKIADYLNLLE
jgi:hypothetical protein